MINPDLDGIDMRKAAARIAKQALESAAGAQAAIQAASIIIATAALCDDAAIGTLERMLTEFDANTRRLFNQVRADTQTRKGATP